MEKSAYGVERWEPNDVYGFVCPHCLWVEKEPLESCPNCQIELRQPLEYGEWTLASDGDGIVCSVCGADFCTIVHETERFHYCPNCGAKMSVEGLKC